MSAYTTLHVTRSTAQRALFEWLYGAHDNERLAGMLDELIKASLYNVLVVADGETNDDDQFESMLQW